MTTFLAGMAYHLGTAAYLGLLAASACLLLHYREMCVQKDEEIARLDRAIVSSALV